MGDAPELRCDLTARAVPELHETVRDRFPDHDLDVRERIPLYRDYVELLLDGDKTTTVRYEAGHVDVPSLKHLPLVATSPESDEEATLGQVEVTAVEVKPFGDLTGEDAERDGFDSLQELIGGLTDIYGDIPDDHPITIYTIEPFGPGRDMRRALPDV